MWAKFKGNSHTLDKSYEFSSQLVKDLLKYPLITTFKTGIFGTTWQKQFPSNYKVRVKNLIFCWILPVSANKSNKEVKKILSQLF